MQTVWFGIWHCALLVQFCVDVVSIICVPFVWLAGRAVLVLVDLCFQLGAVRAARPACCLDARLLFARAHGKHCVMFVFVCLCAGQAGSADEVQGERVYSHQS